MKAKLKEGIQIYYLPRIEGRWASARKHPSGMIDMIEIFYPQTGWMEVKVAYFKIKEGM